MPIRNIIGYTAGTTCQVWEDNNDSHAVCSRYNVTLQDIVDLCGGVPAIVINYMEVGILSVSNDTIKVSVVTQLYRVERRVNFKERIIVNSLMHVFKEGAYTGTVLFLNQVKNAREKGFVELRTQAQGREMPTGVDGIYWDGYYRWARLGYQMEMEDDRKRLKKEVLDFGEYPADTSLGDLVLDDAGYELWKERGFTWSGVFYLAEASDSMTHLRKYLKIKGITFNLP